MPNGQSIRTPDADIVLNSDSLYPPSEDLSSIHRASEFPVCQDYPLYACKISAGFPSPASDYREKDLDLNQFLVDHPSSTFFVRVAGDSMIEAGIMPDDYLVVDRARRVAQNDIVIAVVNGELTVKRFLRDGAIVELRPENQNYPTIKIQAEIELLIWGVVVGVFRKH